MQNLIYRTSRNLNVLVQNIIVASERQLESAKKAAELKQQASNIGNIVKTVAKIADQTNIPVMIKSLTFTGISKISVRYMLKNPMAKAPVMFIRKVPNGKFGTYFCTNVAITYLKSAPKPPPTSTAK